jgi:hypothetical protein
MNVHMQSISFLILYPMVVWPVDLDLLEDEIN